MITAPTHLWPAASLWRLLICLGIGLSLALGCGAKTSDSTQGAQAGAEHSNGAAAAGATPNDTAANGGGTSRGGTAMSDAGMSVQVAGAPAFDVEIPPAAAQACVAYGGFRLALTREQAAHGPDTGGPGEPASGGAGPGWGPCGQCVASCSLLPASNCGPQNDCVTRHCTCDGCAEADLPKGNFCYCAASCLGPGDQGCLNPWLAYVTCVEAACNDVCSRD